MSREIDERVVQMKFENGQFERGIETSIHSMNSLKKSMNFDGAVKGFENLDKSVKAVDMSRLASAVDVVRVKFTLLDNFVWNMFDRISKRAIDTGEQLIKSLSTDQITAGWSKFADKTGAVQTIMSATAKQFTDTGTQMQFVEDQLDKLNWFTDETSYNFLEMVNNIGKFTSNNIDLGESVTAMQGIANWAAISGANANEASRAMYNLSQAISSGSLRLQDWMSIENANMGTAQFKETAIEMGVLAGTLVKRGDEIVTANGKMIVSVENFRETLSEKWLNSDVLMRTLDKYGAATNKLNEIYEELEQNEQNVTTSDIVDAIDEYSNALAKARTESEELGLSAEASAAKASEAGRTVAEKIADEWDISVERAVELLQAFDDETMQFGLKAFKAAQEAKTFRDAIDSVKDAVSTGWMKTFELIFGNYLEAKKLWTGVANELYDLFAEGGAARNELLKVWKDQGGAAYVRDMILGTLKIINALKVAIGGGFTLGFGETTAEGLMNMTKAVHSFISALVPTEKTLERLVRISRGVGSALDILRTLVGGALSKSFKLLGVLLGDTNFSVLEFLARIGDTVYGFRNWVHESTILNDALDRLIDRIAQAKARAGEFYQAFINIPLVKKTISVFKEFSSTIKLDLADTFTAVQNGWTKFMAEISKTPKIASLKDLQNVLVKFYDLVLKQLLNLEERFPRTFEMFKKIGDWIRSFVGSVSSQLGFLEGPFNGLIGIVHHLLDEVGKLFNGINAVDIAMIVFGATIIYTLSKVVKIFSLVSGAVEAITGALGGLGKTFKKWAKAKNVKEYAKAIMYLAVAIRLIAEVDEARAWNAVFVIMALGAALVGMSVAMDKLSDFSKNGGKGAKSLAVMAVSILAISAALYLIGVQGEGLAARVTILTGIVVALGAVAVALNKAAPQLSSSGIAIAAFAVGVLILVGALEKIGSLDVKAMSQGVIGLIGIMTGLALAMRIMGNGGFGMKEGKFKAGNIQKSAASILALAVGVRILIGAIKSLGKMDMVTALSGITLLGAIMVEMGITMRLANKAGGGIKAGGSILALALALNLIIPAIKGLAKIEGETLLRAEAAMIALGAVFVAAIAATRLGGSEAHKAGLMLIEMAAAITLLTVAVRALGGMDDKILLKGVAAVDAIGLVMASTIYASRNTEKAKGALYAITAIIGVLAYSVYQLSKIGWKELLSSTGAMSALIISLGVAMKLMSKIDIDKKGLATLTILGSMTTLFGYIIWRMNAWGDMSNAIQAGVGIAAVVTSLGVAMRIMSGAKNVETGVMKSMATMLAIVAGIGAVLVALMHFAPEGDIKQVLGIVVAIDLLLPVLTTCFLQLDKIQSAPNKTTMAKFNWMAITIGAIGAVIFGISAIPTADAKKAGIVVLALDTLLPVLVVCMKELSKIRKGPTQATMQSLVSFSKLTGIIAAALLGITVIPFTDVDKAIKLVAAIDLFLPVLTACFIALDKFAKDSKGLNKEALGSLAALGVIAEVLVGIIAIFVSNADVDLDRAMQMVLAIDALMLVMTPCMLLIAKLGDGADGVIAASAKIGVAIDVIGVLLAALVALFAAFPQDVLEQGVINGKLVGECIGGFIGGIYGGIINGVGTGIANTLPAIGTALSDFMTNAEGFFDRITKLDGGVIAKAGLLTGVVIALTAADFMAAVETLASGFINKINDFLGFDDSFVDKMETMGDAISAFADACGDIDANKVKTAAEAALLLTALEQNVPRQDGALQSFLGSKDLELFGDRLVAFGGYLSDFVETVAGITEDDVSGAAAAGMAMTKLEDSLPLYGGTLQDWFGSKDLKKFGERLVSFGESLSAYIPLVAGITEEDVNGSANAGKILSDLEKGLVFSDGFVTKFLFGEQNLDSFGERIRTFGRALKKYVELTSGIKESDVAGSAAAIKMLSEVESTLNSSGGVSEFWLGGSTFDQFGANLQALGTSLVNYVDAMNSVDVTQMNLVTEAIEGLVDLGDTVVQAEGWATSLVNNINGLIALMGSTLETKKYTIRMWGANVIMWMTEGLKNGVNTYSKNAKEYAVNLAKEIKAGVEETLEIASPSAVMAEDGKWIVEGIAEGIRNTTSAEEAAAQKASNIEAAFKSAFEKTSLSRTTWDLDLQLWKVTEGYGANNALTQSKEYEYGLKELDSLAQDAATYNAMLETARKSFAEGSKELIEAENQYKQALISMYQKKNELDSMVGTVATDQRDIMKNFAEQLKEASEFGKMLGWTQEDIEKYAGEKSGFDISGKKAYDQIVEQNREAFALLGKSNDELAAFAQEKSGYNLQNASQQLSETGSIIAQALGQQEVTIRETVATSVGRAVRSGVQQASSEASVEAMQGGTDITTAMANGITSALTDVTTLQDLGNAAYDYAGAAVNSIKDRLGIASPSRVTTELGEYAAQGLINGITNLTPAANNSGVTLGIQTIAGLTKGLNDAAPQALSAAQSIANQIKQTIQSALKIHSPSLVTTRFGEYVGIGLANGMLNSMPDVANASNVLSKGSLDALVNAKDHIQSILDMDDDTFTISPVLNMDELKRQATNIPGILNHNNGLDLRAAHLSVQNIAADREFARQNGTIGASQQNNYNFTQNNYSPKALSQAEIYRQTKNQFSRLKGATKK